MFGFRSSTNKLFKEEEIEKTQRDEQNLEMASCLEKRLEFSLVLFLFSAIVVFAFENSDKSSDFSRGLVETGT